MKSKLEQRERRKRRIRTRVHGTVERPRLTVFRSAKHIYAQVINDETGETLVQTGTLTEGVRDGLKGVRKLEAAKKVGEAVAKLCLEKNITKVVFDRNGYVYQAHNRVGTLADAARKAGLNF